MERWIHNARVFSARGGLPCLVMRVPLAPRVIASPHHFSPVLKNHLVRDLLFVPLIGDIKNANGFMQSRPFCS